MEQQVIVRSFISKHSKFSRVTLDRANYEIISESSKASANGRVPKLESLGYTSLNGLNFNKYKIGEVVVFYAWDKSKRGNTTDGPNVFLMETAVAEKCHQPWAGKLNESLDMGEELDMDVINETNSIELGEVVK